jgi:hypothetical protein
MNLGTERPWDLGALLASDRLNKGPSLCRYFENEAHVAPEPKEQGGRPATKGEASGSKRHPGRPLSLPLANGRAR